MSRNVHVVGVGMIPFTKPGASEACHVMGARAARQSLDAAGVDCALIEQRQVEGARLALQHNLGPGGACVVTSYEKVDA